MDEKDDIRTDVLHELTAIKRAIHYLTLILVLSNVCIIAALLKASSKVGAISLVGILVLVVVVTIMLAASARNSGRK